MTSSKEQCVNCGSQKLRLLDNRTLPRGVTSDCKPWPRCGEFAICEACAHTQKIQDVSWRTDVANIYGGYEVYFLSGGQEQVVFDGFQPLNRTSRLLEKLHQRVSLPRHGTMLDVGCANGSTLRSFNRLAPQWQLAGFDITTHSEATIRSIPGVTDFFTGSLAQIDQRFDLLTMLYVVEHLPDTCEVLEQFRRLLKPNGMIWIHTSDFWANPFDLAVVDHASHFMVDTLVDLVERCGFSVIDQNDDWNAKEVGVIAYLPDQDKQAKPDEKKKAQRFAGAPRRFQWLGEVVQHAHAVAERRSIGVFGTAIAGTWLASMAPDAVTYFVDEDAHRVGKTHLGLPVIGLEEVPPEANIYLAFPNAQAEKIRTRLHTRFPKHRFIVPPPLAA